MRVFDVSALQTQVEVYLPIADVRMDRNIVENGNVNVSGELEWEFQRNALKCEIAGLTGARSLCGQLTIQL